MPVLSKFFAGNLGMQLLTTNCYETCHTWNPHCFPAIVDILQDSSYFSFKTYLTVYLVTSLINEKDPRKIDWIRLFRNTLQSSVFLTTNLVGYVFWMCRVRHALGFFIWPTVGLSNGFLSSFFSILLEQKRRRGMLALYLTNLSSETIFRMLVNHGYLMTIPKGECLVLAVGLAIHFYMFDRKWLSPGTENILKYTFQIRTGNILPTDHLPSFMQSLLHILRSFRSHRLCEHENSCISTTLESFIYNFCIGYTLSGSLQIIGSIRQVFRSPSLLIKLLTSAFTFRIPLFFASLPAIYHLSQCAMNRLLNRDCAKMKALSGFLCGLAMLFFPNVSVAMYILWKSIETIYFKGASNGYLPYWKHADIILYTLSTGFVLFMGSIEPHSIRKGYWHFLMGLTGNRGALYNRVLLDRFGFDSSRMAPDFRPKLDSRFVSMNHGLI